MSSSDSPSQPVNDSNDNSSDNPVRPASLDTPSPSANDSIPAEPGSRLLFVIGAVIIAAALGIAAAHAPSRIRLLVLFSLAFGMLTGLIITQFARWMRCRVGTIEILVIGVVTFVGLVGSTWRTFSLESSVKPDAKINPIAAAIINEMQKNGGQLPDDPQIAMTAVEHPAQRFRQYLARRIQALGTWNSPWPEIFWGCEVLAGTFGAVWIGWRHLRQEASP